MKASDLLVKALENEGVEYIFGVPGEENLDFLNSLKDSSIRLILNRHEQGAGFMAATYGRLTGKVGGMSFYAWARSHQPGDTSCLCPIGSHAHVNINGSKAHKKKQTGQIPDH